MGSLLALITDPIEKDRLDEEYNNILREADLAIWDERFLNVIAGEREESDEEKLNRLTHQYSQGRGKIRMGVQSTGAMTLGNAGAGTGATWSTNTAPNTLLTSASMQQAAHQILIEQQKQELQDFKDELRAKRK
jgi:hypothetical protein